jgi:hypothetical protein
VPAQCRPDHALDLPLTGWLDALAAAPLPQRHLQPVPVLLHRTLLGRQPLHPPRLVVLGRRTEPQCLPDLAVVILRRAVVEGVLAELGRIDLHQIRHEPHRRLRYLLTEARELALDLEVLQHQREPQPRRARLVPQQPPVVLDQRPRHDQLIRIPVLLHERGR